jgi:hypothetical protein
VPFPQTIGTISRWGITNLRQTKKMQARGETNRGGRWACAAAGGSKRRPAEASRGWGWGSEDAKWCRPTTGGSKRRRAVIFLGNLRVGLRSEWFRE